MYSPIVLKALAVTCELCGSPELTEAAIHVMLERLSAYPDDAVLDALRRCQVEVKGRLSLADIVQRIDDGRPGAEEAWALCPRDENQTVVWTNEMAQAWGVAAKLQDRIAQRMAFIEAYRRLVIDARSNGTEPYWRVSIGHDVSQREQVVLDAYAHGRLSDGQVKNAIGYLPSDEPLPTVLLPKLHSEVKNLLQVLIEPQKDSPA